MNPIFDVIVVGLGAIGSACVYHLAKRGVRVLGIEQFDIAHPLGSSGGRTRQTKTAPYVGTPYEPLIRRSFELALHWHGRPVDPDEIDRNPTRDDEIEIRKCLSRHFPLADGPLVAVKICMYTHGGPIVSRLPGFRRVSLAAAFGGGGFKFSSAYGEDLADVAIMRKPNLPIEPFAL